MKLLHLTTGLAACLAFVGTGGFMRWTFPEAYEGSDAARMMFRSAHVYVLLSGLPHLLLAVHFRSLPHGWRSTTQRLGSMLLMATPALFVVAFFVEPGAGSLARPIALPTLVLAVLGTALHLAAHAGLSHRPG
jgi:hypothetical protein